MDLFILLIIIASVIGTWLLINSGFRMARRIAVATESTAIRLQALYDALPPEARAQAAEAAAQREKAAQVALDKLYSIGNREDRWNKLKAKPQQ
jgi:hypothetical protein